MFVYIYRPRDIPDFTANALTTRTGVPSHAAVPHISFPSMAITSLFGSSPLGDLRRRNISAIHIRYTPSKLSGFISAKKREMVSADGVLSSLPRYSSISSFLYLPNSQISPQVRQPHKTAHKVMNTMVRPSCRLQRSIRVSWLPTSVEKLTKFLVILQKCLGIPALEP